MNIFLFSDIDPAIAAKTIALHRDIMCVLYPPPHTIMEMCSRTFPQFSQKQLYELIQVIKSSIVERQEIARLQVDLTNQSASRN